MPAGEFQIAAIREAQRLGFEVLAIDRNPRAPGFRHADFALAIDPSDTQAAIAAAREHQVSGVVSVASDPAVIPAALISKALGLPGLDPEVARRCRNKLLGRQVLAQALPEYCPAFKIAYTPEEALRSAVEIGFPVVLKPTEGNGSKGVILVSDEDAMGPAYAYVRQFAPEGPILVEERIVGAEFSVESVTFGARTRVVAITDKQTTPPPYCAEIGHSVPSKLTGKPKEAIETAANCIVAAFGIDNSSSHIEIFHTEDGPKLVEIGARLGGGCITSHLAPLATGVNLTQAVIEIACGRAPDLAPTRQRGAAIRFLTPAPGLITNIDGLEMARAQPGVVEVSCGYAPGDQVLRIENSDHRRGYLIAEGATASEATARADAAVGLIRIQTE